MAQSASSNVVRVALRDPATATGSSKNRARGVHPKTRCDRERQPAMGSIGDAPTYDAARGAAVAEIQRRMDDRTAILISWAIQT